MRCLSFSQDERLQRLSFQARDLLRSMMEVFPELLSEHGRVPADCARLRDACYKHRTDLDGSHLGRWLRELQSHSIVIVYPLSDRSEWLCLAPDFCAGSPRAKKTPLWTADATAAAGQARLDLPKAGGGEVIHISGGLSPPQTDQNSVVAAAACCLSLEDLIARLREHFPRHDVAAEFKRYAAKRAKYNAPPIALLKGQPAPGTFVHWMLNAEVPLTRAAARGLMAKGSQLSPITDNPSCEPQLDLFEERAHSQFMEDFEARKRRRA